MKIQPLWKKQDIDKFKDHPDFVPDEMLSEEWAQINHGQSLKKLNERGGLCVTESLAIIHKDRRYEHILTQEKIDELNQLIKEFTKKNNPWKYIPQ